MQKAESVLSLCFIRGYVFGFFKDMAMTAAWGIALLLLPVTTLDGLRVNARGDGTTVEVSVDLPKDIAAKFAAGALTQEDGEAWLQLCLVTDGKEGPPMLGDYRSEGQKLIFTPRLPLQPDTTYHANFFRDGQKLDTVAYQVPA